MNNVIKSEIIRVCQKPGKERHSGLFSFQENIISASLGRSGISAFKKEGDGVSPRGTFKLLYGYYRKDRVTLPATQFPFFPIGQNDGWCDDVNCPQYNQPVQLPIKASHEKLYREDSLYDICIVLDYNIWPISKNRGSAIFFHLMNTEKGPTEGCVAIERDAMLKLVPHLKSGMKMRLII